MSIAASGSASEGGRGVAVGMGSDCAREASAVIGRRV
jgi:hypothetical protein